MGGCGHAMLGLLTGKRTLDFVAFPEGKMETFCFFLRLVPVLYRAYGKGSCLAGSKNESPLSAQHENGAHARYIVLV